ncbi:phage terminase small subunit P27 family [Micromonospora sp. PSH03]|uniref:phage terminase small subunit P27 family n=1 Tax=Micromonospora salmantinae TaxID=2911211 RepID=UPI001EE81025|nr:phage terminase small subunit P27 family [Micromonospora salmantinae]MCG5459633.1 phage terminase small subunit P27 family [Micromonospora salmantinae]
MADRKPANVKLLHGNPGNRSVTSSHNSTTGIPRPPADLKGEAFAEWCRITSYLAKVGKIELVDYAALVVYCSAWEMFDDARASFQEHGSLIPGRDGGLVKNPAAQIMRDASDTMLKFGGRFGFSPKDRQNLGITSDDADEDDIEQSLAG